MSDDAFPIEAGALDLPAVRPSSTAVPVVLLLLGVVSLINYLDRGNLAVAAPLIKTELGISTTQLGVLLTAFFWTYTAFMYPSGWLADRVNVNWVLAGGFAVWSFATAATALVHGFAFLILVRMLLGAGESVAYPSYSRILACHVAQGRRGLANAVIMAGQNLGPAVGTYGCGMLMAGYGWRPVFLAIGALSLIWLVPWVRWMPDNRRVEHRASGSVAAADILSERSFWGCALGQFCGNYSYYFILIWLPFYLVGERHVSMQTMAREATLFFIAYAVVGLIGGWFGDGLIRRGARVGAVRKSFMATGHAIVAVAALGCAAADMRLALASLVIMGIGSGLVGPNIFLFAQTLAGPSASGKWVGLQNGIANLAGVVVGPVSGMIADYTGHFWWAFAIASAITVIGGFLWVFVVGELAEIQWPRHPVIRSSVSGAAVARVTLSPAWKVQRLIRAVVPGRIREP